MAGYYWYSDIPGAGRAVKVCVIAVNKKDAQNYINLHHPGAKYAGNWTPSSDEPNHHIGAVTDKVKGN